MHGQREGEDLYANLVAKSSGMWQEIMFCGFQQYNSLITKQFNDISCKGGCFGGFFRGI